MRLVVRRRSLLLLLVLFIVVGSAAFIKPGLALYRQRRAGDLISQVMVSQPKITACEFPRLTQENNIDNLQMAITLLSQAIQYESTYSHSYLQLGRAYCLLSQYAKAVEAFKQFVTLRPDNPLGHLEMGFAEQQLCIEEGSQNNKTSTLALSQTMIGICPNSDLMGRIRVEWQGYAIDTNQFLTNAQNYFAKKQYADASIWYQRALKFQLNSLDELSVPDQYKWSVSAIVAQSAFPQLLTEMVPIIEIGSTVTIAADQIRIFREIVDRNINYGDVIHTQNLNQHSVGIMYFGGPAGVFIDVQQEGWYQITVQALNTPPAPVILQLEDGFQPFGKIELNRGDLSWEAFQFKVYLQRGIHLLDLNFVNDGLVNGVDRNAMIEWLKIESTG